MRRILQPWAGLIGGVAGWYLSQQAGSGMIFAQCTRGHWWSVALLGAAGLALVAAGAMLSYRRWQDGRTEQDGWQFVALLSMLLALLLAFPILMQTIAGLLVPGCLS
ncbi:hypothetical protein [Sphingomonas quercus]|uniref:Uncharacterized protein n=1 Tax=Sphingomonas quercus TaxID=2842451 RepID=A0ABS6BIA2_9SPHN|nr:hypothetical protein [Sphingomonas quercus]MBU3077317.1 hypothetical protein [Sphingomonas quercus]